MRRIRSLARALSSIVLISGCSDDSTTGGGTPDVQENGCGSQVTIAFYEDDQCTPGTEVGQRRYDTSLSCFSWSAQGSNATENSATRFQCYADRLCYTQHANTLECDDGGFAQTDKEARTDACLKEPDGTLYSKVLGGTEACPAAPAGFECATSASMAGTDGIVECSSALD